MTRPQGRYGDQWGLCHGVVAGKPRREHAVGGAMGQRHGGQGMRSTPGRSSWVGGAVQGWVSGCRPRWVWRGDGASCCHPSGGSRSCATRLCLSWCQWRPCWRIYLRGSHSGNHAYRPTQKSAVSCLLESEPTPFLIRVTVSPVFLSFLVKLIATSDFLPTW